MTEPGQHVELVLVSRVSYQLSYLGVLGQCFLRVPGQGPKHAAFREPRIK